MKQFIAPLACLLLAFLSAVAGQNAATTSHYHWPPYTPPYKSNTYVAILGNSNTVATAQFYMTVDVAARTAAYNFW